MATSATRTALTLPSPTAEMAVRAPEGRVSSLYRRELATAPDPEAMRAEKVEEFRRTFANPYVAAAGGIIDEGIEPRQTRRKIIAGLAMTRTKRDRKPPQKHGNIPL